MGFKEMFTDYAINHYHSMPKSVQSKMVREGKKKIEEDHPIASLFMTERKKEEYVVNYFTKKEIEHYRKKPGFWDMF